VSASVRVPGLEVGRVKALWRYPVKSMGAEPVRQVAASWHGLAGDRRWAFVREDRGRSGFPWLTIRERADMSQYLPSFVDPDQPDSSPVLVRTPSGADFDVVDPELAADLGGGVSAIKCDRGVFDTMPLSLLTTQTLASLGALVHTPLAVQRFRPNLLIEAVGDASFPEDEWVGAVLQIGGARIRADGRDKRCVVVNIDPVTTTQNPTVLRAIAQSRQARLGIYGSTVAPGIVAVGDPVIISA